MRVGDHSDDPGEHGVAADLLGAHDQGAAAVDGAADDGVAAVLGDRHGLTSDQGLIDGGAAILHGSVDRYRLAGADPEAVTELDGVEGDLFVVAVGGDAAGGLGAEIEQGFDGAGGLLAGAQLQDLPQQDQGGDDGGGFEVDVDGARVTAEGVGEDTRREGGDHAEQPRDSGAHRDQGEHVEVAGAATG